MFDFTSFSFSFAGVSCDACLKGNFRGRRFKCLICYDYDLCASCYESGATTTRHTTEHPMQCILTRVDYGKELSESADRYVCLVMIITYFMTWLSPAVWLQIIQCIFSPASCQLLSVLLYYFIFVLLVKVLIDILLFTVFLQTCIMEETRFQ